MALLILTTLCLLADITRSTKKQSEGKPASSVSMLVGKVRFERSDETAGINCKERHPPIAPTETLTRNFKGAALYS